MISIITPVYNAEKYIAHTISCVLGQTYKDFELILVDDMSTDNSVNIIKNYMNDSRIRLIEPGEKLGAAGARNAGIRQARGRYIAFLDADDCWSRKKLEKQIEFMKSEDAAFTFTSYVFGDAMGHPTRKIVKVPKKLGYKKALTRTVIFTSTVMLDTEKIEKHRIYMPDVPSEDTATWWSILRSGVVARGMNECLVIYTRPETSLSSNKLEAVKRVWNLYVNVEKLGILRSIFLLFGWGIRATLRRI